MALLLLCLKSEKAESNRILALLLLDLSLLLSCMVFLKAGYGNLDLIRLVMTPSLFAAGPLFFLYTKNYSLTPTSFPLKSAAEAAPAGLVIFYYLPKYFSPGWMPFIDYRFMTFFFWYAFLIHFLVYLFIAARLIKKPKRSAEEYPDGPEPAAAWLGFLFVFFVAAFAVMAVITAYDMARLIIGFKGIRLTEGGISLFGVFLICAVSFKGLRHPDIFFGGAEKALGKKAETSIEAAKRNEILAKVSRKMEEDKLYLEPRLSLPALAAKAGVSRGELSAAINAEGDQNFYAFINAQRVRHAQALLARNRDMGVLEAAYESGFTSKSTFNEAFKRVAGCTPSAYRRRFQAE